MRRRPDNAEAGAVASVVASQGDGLARIRHGQCPQRAAARSNAAGSHVHRDARVTVLQRGQHAGQGTRAAEHGAVIGLVDRGADREAQKVQRRQVVHAVELDEKVRGAAADGRASEGRSGPRKAPRSRDGVAGHAQACP